MIIALDTSMKATGFAIGDGTPENTVFGTKSFSSYKADYTVAGRKFAEWLGELIDMHKPAYVVMEQPILFGGTRGGATVILNGLVWEAHREAEFNNIPRAEYAVSTIKKFITGNGKASKDEVIAAVRAKGFAVATDNEADAVAILLLHISKTNQTEEE